MSVKTVVTERIGTKVKTTTSRPTPPQKGSGVITFLGRPDAGTILTIGTEQFLFDTSPAAETILIDITGNSTLADDLASAATVLSEYFDEVLVNNDDLVIFHSENKTITCDDETNSIVLSDIENAAETADIRSLSFRRLLGTEESRFYIKTPFQTITSVQLFYTADVHPTITYLANGVVLIDNLGDTYEYAEEDAEIHVLIMGTL